jgi:hypothetical protein
VYRDVITTGSCTLGLCHGEGASGGGLTLQPRARAYESLVNAPSRGRQCAVLGLREVEPGHPERSLLFLKLTEVPCGSQMPPDEPLGQAAFAQVERWILEGAPFD